jgi:ATP-binding cassette subfamily B protein
MAGTDRQGTSAYGLIRAFESIGFTAKGVRCSREGLRTIPRPAILHIASKTGQHYVVFAGIKGNRIRIMNPSTGEMEKHPVADFCSKWSGIAIIIAPGDLVDPGERASNRSRFLHLIRPHRTVLIHVFTGSIIYTLLGFSTSLFIQKLTDTILVYELRHYLHIAGAVFVVIIFFQLLLLVIKNRMILSMGQLIDSRLMLGYYRYLIRLPQPFFDTMRTGEIISRINDAAKIRQYLSETLPGMVLNGLIVGMSIVILVMIHPRLACIVTILVPVYAIIYLIYNYLNKKQERDVMEKSAEVESQLVESLRTIRTVKLLDLAESVYHRVEHRFIAFLDALFLSGKNLIFSQAATEFTNRTITLIMLWIGALLVLSRELTLGQLMSFYAILGYMTGPAASLIGVNKTLQNARIAADRLFEIMDLEVEEKGGGAEFKDPGTKGIVFRDVSFSYGSRGNLFEGINLMVPASRLTLIVGASGSGKSTLAYLITGLYRVSAGRIELDGKCLQEYTTESLRERISIVPQQTELFSGSLLANIAPGELHADYDRARELCDRLGLSDLIMKLPSGLHTEIGENGTTFSGGERQRISIARALYRQPSVLILDEALSSLDGTNSSIVRKVIARETERGTTVIMITHDVQDIATDHIIIMDHGRVLAEGKEAWQLLGERSPFK